MIEKKYRCTKCGAMEVVFVEPGVDPMNIKPPKFVCQKCGNEYGMDSDVSVINNKTINPFPNPQIDLDVDDPLTKRIQSKRRTD